MDDDIVNPANEAGHTVDIENPEPQQIPEPSAPSKPADEPKPRPVSKEDWYWYRQHEKTEQAKAELAAALEREKQDKERAKMDAEKTLAATQTQIAEIKREALRDRLLAKADLDPDQFGDMITAPDAEGMTSQINRLLSLRPKDAPPAPAPPAPAPSEPPKEAEKAVETPPAPTPGENRPAPAPAGPAEDYSKLDPKARMEAAKKKILQG